jgi:hypothetical protein
MNIYTATIKVKTDKGFEKRIYSVIAPNEEFVQENILKAFKDQLGAEIEELKKEECFVLRIK